MIQQEQMATIEAMVVQGKGILAADESVGTLSKRFATINTEPSEENRRTYRSLLATTPELERHISGVILFEETLDQKTDDGINIPDFLSQRSIVPGVKVDKGLVDLANFPNEKITQGLDGLGDRLRQYKEKGARFAKWRNVHGITNRLPSWGARRANAEMLARYAAVCQSLGIVPIVEPEVLMEGDHDIERCAEVSRVVLNSLFHALSYHRVVLEHIILKPSMVLPGQSSKQNISAEQVAEATLKVLRSCVPVAVPSINFLSGGQSSERATENLQAMNALGAHPWNLSFSYGRALQEQCLATWQGQAANRLAAQQILLKRAKLNGEASSPRTHF